MGKRQQRFQGAGDNDLVPHSFNDNPRRRSAPLKPQTDNQHRYIQTIKARTITFGLGPAGTGKTFVATSLAAEAFRDKEIEKIIVSRPIVEAGESIGFLPGEMGEKIDPYFVPVREVLEDVLGKGLVEYALKERKIEFAPLAFMRGRTFKGAMVILDEAQNTTPKQMKMFLTRLGEGSKLIINGDLLQSDIPGVNGLRDARDRLRDVPDIGMITFRREDIVRHGLVRDITDAYEGTGEPEQPHLPGFLLKSVDVDS